MTHDDYQTRFNFSYFLFVIIKMARRPTASLCDCQNPQTPATELVQRATTDLYYLLCLHGSSCLRCQGKAYSITAIPECALAATKPDQPAPCG